MKKLLEILKNRAKVGGISFLLELTVGVLSEWQRQSTLGALDADLKKQQNQLQNQIFDFDQADDNQNKKFNLFN